MKIFNILCLSLVFAINSYAETTVNWEIFPIELEVNQSAPISIRTISDIQDFPNIDWELSHGEVEKTSVVGEVFFNAPASACTSIVTATVKIGDKVVEKKLSIVVLEEGALKKTADILIEVDTNALQGVWVDKSHPSENFTAPLMVKGTFRYDPESGLAFAGGSWPSYVMFDDGTHGDKVADDGIWSINMEFQKSDAGVYIAFDDASDYRIEFESGIMWRVKRAFTELDEFPDDHSNIKFVPDDNKSVSWTKELSIEGGIYEEN